MWKCKNCGTEFEGKFCPECGTKREEERICPQCGAVLPANAKFCLECGTKWESGEAAGSTRGKIHSAPAEPRYEEPLGGEKSTAPRGQREDAESGAEDKRKNVFTFFTEERLRKIYRALAIVPAAMCALFSFLLFMFCLAPSAEMLDIFMGGTSSIGNVYDLNDASSQTIMAFASIGFALAGIALLFLFLPKLKWREIPFRRIPVWGALSVLTFAVYFAPFVAACIICSDVAKLDGGLGALKVGAGPILIIVFSLLFLLMLGGAGCARYFISRKYPAFATEEKDARTALAKQYERPIPDEKTQFLMRLRTAMQKKTFLRWSIPFVVIASCLLTVLVGFACAYNSLTNAGIGDASSVVYWIAFIVLTLGIGGFCVGILRSKKVRIPSLDLQTTLKKSQKWFRGACIAYTIVGTIVLGLLITAWLTAFQGSIDELSLEESWLRGFLLFVTAVILAIVLLDIALSFSGRRNLKQIKNYMRTRERVKEIDLHTINAVPEERRAKALRRGFPAAVLAGLLIMTILVVSGVGYSIFSTYKLDKINIGDPYTTVMRTIGNPDEGRDSSVWTYYSEEYNLLQRNEERYEEMQKQLEELREQRLNAKTEEEISDLNDQIIELAREVAGLKKELNNAEYRYIVVTFTADGYVTSVTKYRVYNNNQIKQVTEYEKPSQQKK